MPTVKGRNNTATRNSEQDIALERKSSLLSSSLSQLTIRQNNSRSARQLPSTSVLGSQMPSTSRHNQQTHKTSGLNGQPRSVESSMNKCINLYNSDYLPDYDDDDDSGYVSGNGSDNGSDNGSGNESGYGSD